MVENGYFSEIYKVSAIFKFGYTHAPCPANIFSRPCTHAHASFHININLFLYHRISFKYRCHTTLCYLNIPYETHIHDRNWDPPPPLTIGCSKNPPPAVNGVFVIQSYLSIADTCGSAKKCPL